MVTKSQGYYGNKPVKEKEGTGGLVQVATKMKMPRKQSCAECPLLRTAKAGYLGGYTPAMYVEVMHGPASIACHSSKGFHDGNIPLQRHCTGIAAFRANVGHICTYNGSITGAQSATDAIGPDAERFFASDDEFTKHHSK